MKRDAAEGVWLCLQAGVTDPIHPVGVYLFPLKGTRPRRCRKESPPGCSWPRAGEEDMAYEREKSAVERRAALISLVGSVVALAACGLLFRSV